MKLEIQSVKFRNFLSFGSVAQEIPFHPGVNVILGKDLTTGRSNGSGKSSMMETVPFALYNTTHKNIKKEQLVNWRSQKHCEVELSFKKGVDDYRVLRAIKPDTLEIWKNNGLIPRPAHVKDYQLILEEILGQRYNTFGSLLHSNLNSSNRILDMGKPEKRKFIEDVFGLEIYSMLNEKARLKINSFDTKIVDFSKDIEHNEINIINSERRIDVLNEKLKTFGSSEIQLQDAKIELQELKDKHPNIDNKIDGTSTEIEKLQVELKVKDVITSNIENRIRGLSRRVKDSQDKLAEIANSEAVRKEFAEFCKAYGTPSELSNTIKNIKANLEAIEKRKIEKAERLQQTEISLAKVDSTLTSENQKLNNLIDHKECPTCGQTIQGKGKTVLKKLKDELVTINEEHQNLSANVISAKEECAAELYNSNDRKALLNDAEQKRDHLYQLKDKIKDIGNEKEFAKKLDKYGKAINKLELLSGKIFIKYKELGNTLNILGETKDNYAAAKNNIERYTRRVDELQNQIKLEEKTKGEFLAMMDTESSSIKELKIVNDNIIKKQKTFSSIIDYLAAIRDICKDERVKQYAISSIMPYINQQVNHYLSEVGYGFYCVIDKWLESKIKGPGVRKATYGSLSGGEARGIDLAMQFALLDVARLQAGVWPDIVVMDEILDSSVDGKGIDKLMGIIKNKQREESSKIFIISHRDEIGDEFDADNTYFVEKDGYSIVSIL